MTCQRKKKAGLPRSRITLPCDGYERYTLLDGWLTVFLSWIVLTLVSTLSCFRFTLAGPAPAQSVSEPAAAADHFLLMLALRIIGSTWMILIFLYCFQMIQIIRRNKSPRKSCIFVFIIWALLCILLASDGFKPALLLFFAITAGWGGWAVYLYRSRRADVYFGCHRIIAPIKEHLCRRCGGTFPAETAVCPFCGADRTDEIKPGASPMPPGFPEAERVPVQTPGRRLSEIWRIAVIIRLMLGVLLVLLISFNFYALYPMAGGSFAQALDIAGMMLLYSAVLYVVLLVQLLKGLQPFRTWYAVDAVINVLILLAIFILVPALGTVIMLISHAFIDILILAYLFLSKRAEAYFRNRLPNFPLT